MDAILEVRGLVKDFGGLRAIDNVDFSLGSGEIRAIIGPNGAGKTTFFNLLSGFLKPSSGKIVFKGENITGVPPFKAARKGMIRTFQVSHIFPGISVYENVLLSSQARRIKSLGIFMRKSEKIEAGKNL